jgi:hypothetical protein
VNYFTLKTAPAASWPGLYSAASDGPPKVSPITVWTPLAAVFGLLIGSLVTAWFGYIGHSQDLDVKMVEIGIGILRAPADDDIASIRSWALDVIEKKSGFPFTEEQREVLLQKPLDLVVSNTLAQISRNIQELAVNKPSAESMQLMQQMMLLMTQEQQEKEKEKEKQVK